MADVSSEDLVRNGGFAQGVSGHTSMSFVWLVYDQRKGE